MQHTTDPTPEGDSTVVVDAVRELDRELSSRSTQRWLRRLGIVLALGALGAGAYWAREAVEPPPPARFATDEAERRDIVEKIQSTGKVKPVKEVQVGAQVSGRVVDVHVDYNSQVEEGDLLAEIDPRLFTAQVSETHAMLDAAKADVARAEANLATARVSLERAKLLQSDGLQSRAALDQAKGAHRVAEAEVAAAKARLAQLKAQLESNRTTLRYTKIFSPIDGVIVDRAVEPGQTVASSFSAPVLFVIAQDLKKMQVLADIDEADVGKLREGMDADVVVDAFPAEHFEGEVSQIRYSPNEVQGVVTYSAVVDVDNPQLKLRPGMTATVTIVTNEAEQAVAVPNAALRFRPVSEDESETKAFSTPLEHGQGRVYVPAGGEPGQERALEKIVKIGITDGAWTEIIGDSLGPGTAVVTEQRDKPERRKFLGLF